VQRYVSNLKLTFPVSRINLGSRFNQASGVPTSSLATLCASVSLGTDGKLDGSSFSKVGIKWISSSDDERCFDFVDGEEAREVAGEDDVGVFEESEESYGVESVEDVILELMG
jgi:hypothetical protein